MEAKSCAPRGVCITNAPYGFHEPQPFWIGSNTSKAPLFCPRDVGAFGGGRSFADLNVPSPGCPACVCGDVTGTCSSTPGTILVRAATCEVPQAYTYDFGAPASWDGSCTSVNALPASAECPPGSGILCAQSIYISALPDPVGVGCEPVPPPVPSAREDAPSSNKPKAPSSSNDTAPSWGRVALSCNGSEAGEPGSCGASAACRFELPIETAGEDDGGSWRYCARHQEKGIHPCMGSWYTEQIVVYPDDAKIDTRGCTSCECKASGGSCYATFAVYEDDACTVPVTTDGIGSTKHDCNDVIPAGRPLGSKQLLDLHFVPGTCHLIGGGSPFGTVELDETKAETWCCGPLAK
ncbi:hypothetical protein [Polyangium sp. 6x1]|uniref:hypothetical protein n=1 Tax=Polyangium sp. 6x1 TaxID=3042689 RepID=UPI00248212A2|nr:hypothetical protein [Polyangium sp. 6x1]MDI1451702.1 hypothetical protein [Polyangium sp. 6x1]